jgi:hypothetical protein
VPAVGGDSSSRRFCFSEDSVTVHVHCITCACGWLLQVVTLGWLDGNDGDDGDVGARCRRGGSCVLADLRTQLPRFTDRWFQRGLRYARGSFDPSSSDLARNEDTLLCRYHCGLTCFKAAKCSPSSLPSSCMLTRVAYCLLATSWVLFVWSFSYILLWLCMAKWLWQRGES